MVARHAFAHGFDHGGWAGHGGYWHNHYGYGWGWGGPVFWPDYYDDALFFALWPDDYYDPFFDYGPDALFAGLFWPGYPDSGYGAYSGAYWSGNLYAEAPPSQHRRRGRHQQRSSRKRKPTLLTLARQSHLTWRLADRPHRESDPA